VIMRQGQIHKCYLSVVIVAVVVVDGFRSNTLSPATTVEIFDDESASSSGAEESRRRALQRVAGMVPALFGEKALALDGDSGLMQKEEFERQTVESTTTLISRNPSARRLTTDEESRIEIFERVAPSVVYIDTFSERRVNEFSTNTLEVPIGSGSGFVWDREGHIVTNFHVVQQAKTAQVTVLTPGGDKPSVRPAYTSARPGTILPDFVKTVYKAVVVGADPAKDIAVLKLVDIESAAEDLKPIEVGTSSTIRVGMGALAIGNPFGLDHTLTGGIISGIGREVKSPTGRPISNVIQTDAPINPGNSGGPLLDMEGKLLGVATAIYSPSGASAGVGFAIPADTVSYIVQMLIEKGQIVRPLLGIALLESKQARQALGVTKGVLIAEVIKGSSAESAGLRGIRSSENGIIEIGDIITAIDDMPVEKDADLYKIIDTHQPGDEVKIKVNRHEITFDEEGLPEVVLKERLVRLKLMASDDKSILNMNK